MRKSSCLNSIVYTIAMLYPANAIPQGHDAVVLHGEFAVQITDGYFNKALEFNYDLYFKYTVYIYTCTDISAIFK